MKRILVSLSIIGVVGAIAIGGTIAYFSDVETSTGNTFSAGTLDLIVNSENPFTAAVVVLYDMKPGQESVPITVRLRNDGSIEGIADLHIKLGTSNEGFDSEPECEAEGKIWNEEYRMCEGEEILNENICEKIITRYCYDSVRDWNCDEKDVQGIIGPSQSVDLGILRGGVPGTRYLWLSFYLDKDAGNEYQGDTCTFNIEFTLHQIIPE